MKTFRILLAASVASGALSTGAFAQSSGSVDFEDTIIVTGTRSTDVSGIQAPNTTKAKAVLEQEIISHSAPGQTINDVINLVPGVSFQNNDPFGSAGGTLNIRGFDSSRVSQTFDGVPLNDSGNYALYSNQQLDPELIEQVNVNLGTTDVDSPTASATGSTVNYRTMEPLDDLSITASLAAGDFSFYRMFGVVHTGAFTPWGTKAFFSASKAGNDNIYGAGKIDKQQYNARIYQPIGDNGDFISIAGHYNQNRNNFFGSVSYSAFPTTKDGRFYDVGPCTTDAPQSGVQDFANSCGTTFDERVNPSNTGNIRVQSRFTLADGLVLTVDPSFQYVKANGGGTVLGRESVRTINGVNYTGFIGGQYYFGVDLNGDGDTLDTCSQTGGSCSSSNLAGVRLLAPSQTQTRRYGLIASLRYDLDANNTVRLAYSYDRARHRQTGELGGLQTNGRPFDVFPVNDGLTDVNGIAVQKRDRLSYATLNQISGEYTGKFLDEALRVNIGVRLPFFIRDLTNYCFTTSANGFVDCFGQNAALNTAYAAANPGYSAPQNRHLTYNKFLPNVGFIYSATNRLSVFANYSKGLQVPGTDNLYNSFYFPVNTAAAQPTPEETDNFDLGGRYTSSTVQAQLTLWYTNYSNRLASAYDVELDRTVYRNLGQVKKYGIDGSIAYRPIKEFMIYTWGSYLKSEIQDNVQTGTTAFAATAGKRESGAPIFTLGARAQVDVSSFHLGAQIKRTGKRYINDINTASAPGYTLVDLDARVTLEKLGLNEKTYLQINVVNLFDELYVGGFSGDLTSTSPFVQIGYPRTFMASFVMSY